MCTLHLVIDMFTIFSTKSSRIKVVKYLLASTSLVGARTRNVNFVIAGQESYIALTALRSYNMTLS